MAFTLELYFVTAWRTIDQHQDVFARLFRVYGMGDSTYYGQGDVALPFALETINVFLTQGLNIALIVAIVRGLPWRYPLQLAVSSYVAYSVLLYFWHAHAGGYPAMPVHSPLAFFVFYAPNLPWFLGNLWMAGSAFRAMTARLGPARAAGEPSPSAAAGVPAAAGVITGRGKRSEAAPALLRRNPGLRAVDPLQPGRELGQFPAQSRPLPTEHGVPRGGRQGLPEHAHEGGMEGAAADVGHREQAQRAVPVPWVRAPGGEHGLPQRPRAGGVVGQHAVHAGADPVGHPARRPAPARVGLDVG
ncbi:EXPERA domain-containing protein [Streptomyces stramineus]